MVEPKERDTGQGDRLFLLDQRRPPRHRGAITVHHRLAEPGVTECSTAKTG